MHWSYPATELWLGGSIVFAATVLEFLGLPAPGRPLLVIAGAEAAIGNKEILFLTLVAGVGAAVGDAPWYFLGRYGGARVLHFYCKLTLGSRSCVANTERFFHRFGILTLLFSKFLPGVRLFAPPFAGSTGYPLSSFFCLDLLGGFLWAGSLVLSGSILGPHISWALKGQWVWVFTFVPVVVFFLGRLVKRMIKGPAENAFLFKPHPQPSGPSVTGSKETMI
ncbi:MAG: DedA family protein [Acidobacteria bacterium]|nr:MAG: DedA family protein [Acidobacteriota bacterium]